MTKTDTNPNPFWQFSLAVYGQPDIPPLCLDLQDRAGADVNMMLFCCWLAVSGRGEAPPDFVSDALFHTNPWRREVVLNLRAARTTMKTILATDPPETADMSALRVRIKRDELEAERIQQDMLWRLAEQLVPDSQCAAPSQLRTAHTNLTDYAQADLQDPDQWSEDLLNFAKRILEAEQKSRTGVSR